MQFTKTLLVSSLFLWISTLEAFDGTSTPRPEQLKSAAWWREQAVRYTDEIADADARGRAHYALAYSLAGGGDLDAARASAGKINNPQLRVYAHCFVAKTYKQKGDDNACLSELQEARKVALEWANISGDSAVIHAYVDMGYLAEAVAFATEIPADSPNRTYSLQNTAAALAEKGHLDMALDLVEHRIPPIGREGALSQMANACAGKLRLQDVEKLTAQMTNVEFQNRAYVHLVEALVQADRLAEAASFADRISDPARKRPRKRESRPRRQRMTALRPSGRALRRRRRATKSWRSTTCSSPSWSTPEMSLPPRRSSSRW